MQIRSEPVAVIGIPRLLFIAEKEKPLAQAEKEAGKWHIADPSAGRLTPQNAAAAMTGA